MFLNVIATPYNTRLLAVTDALYQIRPGTPIPSAHKILWQRSDVLPSVQIEPCMQIAISLLHGEYTVARCLSSRCVDDETEMASLLMAAEGLIATCICIKRRFSQSPTAQQLTRLSGILL